MVLIILRCVQNSQPGSNVLHWLGHVEKTLHGPTKKKKNPQKNSPNISQPNSILCDWLNCDWSCQTRLSSFDPDAAPPSAAFLPSTRWWSHWLSAWIFSQLNPPSQLCILQADALTLDNLDPHGLTSQLFGVECWRGIASLCCPSYGPSIAHNLLTQCQFQY